jgi:hypothetical protein
MSMRTTTRCILALVLPLATIGCATGGVTFTEGPVISVVDDTADIPEPKEAPFARMYHHERNFFHKQLRLRLDPMPPRPAPEAFRERCRPSAELPLVKRARVSSARTLHPSDRLYIWRCHVRTRGLLRHIHQAKRTTA